MAEVSILSAEGPETDGVPDNFQLPRERRRTRLSEVPSPSPVIASTGDLPPPRWQNTKPTVMKVYLLNGTERQEIRRFTIGEATYEALISDIRRYFQISSSYELYIKYKDCESELVTVSSTHELELGFQFRKHNQMKIFVEKRKKKKKHSESSSTSTKVKKAESGSGDSDSRRERRKTRPEGTETPELKRRERSSTSSSSTSSSPSTTPTTTPPAFVTSPSSSLSSSPQPSCSPTVLVQETKQVLQSPSLTTAAGSSTTTSGTTPFGSGNSGLTQSGNRRGATAPIRREIPSNISQSSPQNSNSNNQAPEAILASTPLPAEHLISAQAFINRYFQTQSQSQIILPPKK